MKKYSILMYNFNNYEIMHEPEELDPECDYIYVTDDPTLKSDKWRIVIDPDLDGMSTFEKCYAVRFNLFKYAKTDVCIYMDGNFQIHKSLRKLYDDFMASGAELGVHVHFARTQMVPEYATWVNMRGYPQEQAFLCLGWMEAQNYDLQYKGLYEGSFRICKNTDTTRMIDKMTLGALKHSLLIHDGYPIERLDQTLYSFILNRWFDDTVKIFPISPKFFFNGFLSHCAHKSNWPLPDISEFDTKGWVFNKEVDLYVG